MMTSTINIKSHERHFFSVAHASASLKRVIIYTSIKPKYARASIALPSWVNIKLKRPALSLKLGKCTPESSAGKGSNWLGERIARQTGKDEFASGYAGLFTNQRT
jgi:hypothetical protein